jgi:phage tail sheath protein FI
MLRPVDLIGRDDAPTPFGLRRFERVDQPAGLAIPDAVIPPLAAVERPPPPPPPVPDPCEICAPPVLPRAAPPPPPFTEASPAFSADDVAAIQAGLVGHCEARGDRVALLDPPLHADGPDPWDLAALAAWRQRFDSSYAAAYFPWATLVDPIAVPPAATRDTPFSGHALGQFALADAEARRPAPANRPVQFISALPRRLEEEEHALLNQAGINCVRIAPGRGIRIMGARTLASRADLAQLTVRRTLIRLKRMLSRSLRWAVLEPNGDTLRNLVVAQIEGFLESEWEAQRLSGASAEEAFYVRPLTTLDDFDNGRFLLEIGVAPSVPAEFVILRLSRSEDRLDLAELSDSGGWPS